MQKYFCTYSQIHHIVQKTAPKIINSGFDPDYILAVGGGGFIPARILRTYIKRPIISISVAYYNEKDQLNETPKKIQWLDAYADIKGKKILIVDEVDDTRATLEYCLNELLILKPSEIAVFVIHNKDKVKHGKYPESIKHIFVGEQVSDKWICYPWDAGDLALHDQLARNK